MPKMVRTPGHHLVYPPRADTRVCFFVSKTIDPDNGETKEHSADLWLSRHVLNSTRYTSTFGHRGISCRHSKLT